MSSDERVYTDKTYVRSTDISSIMFPLIRKENLPRQNKVYAGSI